MRLIDADELKWKLERVTLYVQGLRFGKTMLGKILESYRRAVFEEIDNARTVDAVEVVRCKDCVHYINLLENGSDYRCSIFSGCYDRPYPTEADDFCSYGERKEVTK